MNRQELIDRIKASNVHVWSKTFAGKEEVFVEGRIEYFEDFVEALVADVLDVLNEGDQIRSMLTSSVILKEKFFGEGDES